MPNPSSLTIQNLLSQSIALDPERAATLAQTADDAAEFLRAARAAGTRSAYASDWRQFAEWVQSHGLEPLPADPRMIALWISHMARQLGRRPATIRRMLATIGTVHRMGNHPNPCQNQIVREEMRGITNALGARPKRAAPILIAHLEAIVAALPPGLRGARDKAVLLVGWSGALRRSEIAALAFMDQGARVLIQRSKTDQAGEGAYVALFHAARKALCPVQALQDWIRAAALDSGPLFRRLTRHREPTVLGESISGPDVLTILERWTRLAGIQPEQRGDTFSPHSLRAGFITEAARASKAEWQIAKQSRHKSATVLRTYIRIADTFQGNAGEGLL